MASLSAPLMQGCVWTDVQKKLVMIGTNGQIDHLSIAADSARQPDGVPDHSILQKLCHMHTPLRHAGHFVADIAVIQIHTGGYAFWGCH